MVDDTFFLFMKFYVFFKTCIFFLVGSRPGIFLEFLVVLSTPGGLDDAKGSSKRVMADLGDQIPKR